MQIRIHALLVGCVGLAMGASVASAQPRTYLAMGDSYGFGYLTGNIQTEYGAGDWGYAGPFASALASRAGFGGVRPTVVNVSVPGESVSSFYDTSNLGRIYNSHYNFFSGPSQRDMLLQKVASEQVAGRVVSTVSISMGGNDLLALRDQAGFTAQPMAQQQLAVDAAVASMRTGYSSILTTVRGVLPEAELIMVGYFNPFPGAPGSPFAPVSEYAITSLNAAIASLAAERGATFVDIGPRFVGHEAEWSYIGASPVGSNIHPNVLGYQQIAGAMAAAVGVPAPAAGSVGMCVLGWTAARRRRRAA